MSKLLRTIGSNVRALRMAQEISQEELALRSGLHRTYVGAIERGERNVSALNIEKLADALMVRPSSLLESDG